MKVALYARVSTSEQTVENQRLELLQYVSARGWTVTKEYLDEGVSGSKESRPALDELVKDAKRRRFDVLVVSKLDRLGRNLKHLVTLVDDLRALGIAFVSLGEGIDATTPAGKLQLHILAAIAEFERARIQERVKAGLARAKAQGRRLGRPAVQVSVDRVLGVGHLSIRDAAGSLGVSTATLKRWRRVAHKSPTPAPSPSPLFGRVPPCSKVLLPRSPTT